MNNTPFYITTPIYYVNDYPHIGHAYTTVAADVMARYHRLMGKPVYFLTGTDEHGQKIQRTAAKNEETPIDLANRVVQRFEKLWQVLNISHDDFIRTTQMRHKKGALELFQRCFDNGDIYPGQYEGWYAVNDEEFLTETQVQEMGLEKLEADPNIIRLKETTYYFRLSKYQDALLAHLDQHPEFVQPEARRNEVRRFIEQGLKDLSISRTSFDWGIALPQDDKHVMYVWMDALSNYITALGFGQNQEKMNTFWPASVHMVGKDILRFHAIFWPAFLLSAGLPLPKTVFAHGWWTVEGEKMSKSKGNFVDPFQFVDEYGADPFRYFLLREFTFGQDGNFSQEHFVTRLNTELANELGNLVSRTTSMVNKYFEGVLPPCNQDQLNAWLASMQTHVDAYHEKMQAMQFDQAFGAIWAMVRKANQHIEAEKPWALAKDENQKPALQTLMNELLETIATVSILLAPVMPTFSQAMREKLSLVALTPNAEVNYFQLALQPQLKVGVSIEKGEALFQRIETSEP
jgi:methionyl-tRNA synthetase